MPDLTLGQEVWYVDPYYLIAVKTKINEIDDEFRKKEPQAYLDYFVEEPIGHSLHEEDLVFSREEAICRLLRHYDEYVHYSKDWDEEIIQSREADINMTLDKFRKKRIEFIVKTWELSPEETSQEEKEFYDSLPAKDRGDWFNVKDAADV